MLGFAIIPGTSRTRRLLHDSNSLTSAASCACRRAQHTGWTLSASSQLCGRGLREGFTPAGTAGGGQGAAGSLQLVLS